MNKHTWLFAAMISFLSYAAMTYIGGRTFASVMMITCIAHESGHAIACKAHRGKVAWIIILPCIGFTKLVGIECPRALALATLAGPITGIFTAGLCVYTGHILGLPEVTRWGSLIALYQAIDLLPTPLTDGGHISPLFLRTTS